jgi:hypothetical protein
MWCCLLIIDNQLYIKIQIISGKSGINDDDDDKHAESSFERMSTRAQKFTHLALCHTA